MSPQPASISARLPKDSAVTNGEKTEGRLGTESEPSFGKSSTVALGPPASHFQVFNVLYSSSLGLCRPRLLPRCRRTLSAFYS